jgi:hypothetical protein
MSPTSRLFPRFARVGSVPLCSTVPASLPAGACPFSEDTIEFPATLELVRAQPRWRDSNVYIAWSWTASSLLLALYLSLFV